MTVTSSSPESSSSSSKTVDIIWPEKTLVKLNTMDARLATAGGLERPSRDGIAKKETLTVSRTVDWKEDKVRDQ